MKLIEEFRRRKLVPWALAYAAAAFAVVQGVDMVASRFDWPDSVGRVLIIAAFTGLFVTLLLAWFHGERGAQRVSLLEMAALAVILLAGAALAWRYAGIASQSVQPERHTADTRIGESGKPDETGAPKADPKSIAVLPFDNLSGEPQQDYFSEGVAEDVLNLLTKVSGLKVTARTSSFSFREPRPQAVEIGDRLRVAYLLDGTVQKSGERVRVTVRLIDAKRDLQLWSERWDRRLDDVFAIQDEIAAAVVQQLQVTLLGDAPRARSTDPRAYDLYLEGLQLGRLVTRESIARSDGLYRRALALDPNYAPAWNELARNALNANAIGMLSTDAARVRAESDLARALELDPQLAAAHARLGFVLTTMDRRIPEGAGEIRRAIAIDPANPEVRRFAGMVANALGRTGDALALGESVVRMDPLNSNAHYFLGVFQLGAGRLDDAIASFHRTLELAPGRGNTRAAIALTLLRRGDAEGALREVGQETSEQSKKITLPLVYDALGRRADADRALSDLVAIADAEGLQYAVAAVHAGRGERDLAFDWLERGLRAGEPNMLTIGADPTLDGLHQDPRWTELLGRMGRAPEQLAGIDLGLEGLGR